MNDTPNLDPTPATVAEVLDPHWLAAVLDDVEDTERIVAVEPLGQSETLASKIRLSATIESAAGDRRTRTYCIKAHFNDVSGETLLTEAHVYRDLRPLLDVRTPNAYYTGIDDATGRSLIIMDDVISDGGRFLSAHEPYSPETCREALRQLARLHAATWNDPRWDLDWLSPRIQWMSTMYPLEVLQQMLDDGRGADVAPELLDAEQLMRAMASAAALPATCVIHADTHSGNVYLDALDRPCWIDWQVTQRGHWSTDVCYHIATALDIEDRRTHEQDLLRSYLDELGTLGVEPPSWDEAWHRYTLGFTWGYFMWVITRISSRAVVLIHMPRLGAALSDHDTFRRLAAESA